jgi:hypothetical protein
MSIKYLIDNLEIVVPAGEEFSTADSLYFALLDQKQRLSSAVDINPTPSSQDIICLKSVIKNYISSHLHIYEEELLVAGARYFGLSEVSRYHHNFLIPGLLHEFMFGAFQNVKMSLEIFASVYNISIQVNSESI